jgi:hypothetical protein
LVYIDDIQYGREGLFSEQADGSVVMFADGADIWGTSDEFRFAYKELTGDGSITARVERIANTNVWAKAGVMIRQDLTGPAANAALVVTPGNGVSFQYRLTAGADCGSLAEAGLTAPYWVKLTRTGDVFTAQYSADGVVWEEIVIEAGVEVALGDPVYIGLAVTSHSDGVMTMGSFSNIETTGEVSGDWQALGIGLD